MTKPKRTPPINKPENLTKLTPKHALLIELIVFGSSRERLCAKLGVQPGQPLSLEQACDALLMRRRLARKVLASPAGHKAQTQALAALRNGAKASAMHRIIELVNNEGEGKAADRKVQLEAARDILGLKDPAATQVNVQVNTTNNVQPGYVIRDPRQTKQTIDLQATEQDNQID